MNELIVNQQNYEIDVFDRSLYPFYKQSNVAIYSVVQENSIKKITDTLVKGNLIKEIISTNLLFSIVASNACGRPLCVTACWQVSQSLKIA